MNGFNVKKDDTVMVITGKEKGKSGKIISVDRAKGRVQIEGLNIVSKAVKPRTAKDVGGIIKHPGTIDISNVMPICGSCGKATRVGNAVVEIEGKSVKKRICKKCGAQLDVAMSKAKRAAKKTTAKSKSKVVAEKEKSTDKE